MRESEAHFVILPERRQDLWHRMSDFLGKWKEVPSPPHGLGEAELVAAERALGLGFPAALRELYAELGGWLDAGGFDDGDNVLLRPEECHLVGDPKSPQGETLVIGDEYHGAQWGVRREDVALADPPIRCIDTGGWANDGLFLLTEFLVGLLFRAAVVNAPLSLRVKSTLRERGEAEELHDALLAHFPSWDRGEGERDCGFVSHIEGDRIIAAWTERRLDLGLKGEDAISHLPEPLSGLIAELVRRRG